MSLKSKVLNLYSQDESSHFRIEPKVGKVTIQYDYGESCVDIAEINADNLTSLSSTVDVISVAIHGGKGEGVHLPTCDLCLP